MQISREEHGVWVVFKLVGKLDMQSAPELDKVALPEAEKGLDVALDMQGVDYISSMGIRSMVTLAKKTYDKGHTTALIGFPEEVKAILNSAGVLTFFTIYENPVDMPFSAAYNNYKE